MGVVGSLKRWLCDGCRVEGIGIEAEFPVGWHAFSDHLVFCPVCWAGIWSSISPLWQKLGEVRMLLEEFLNVRVGDREGRRNVAADLASALLTNSVSNLIRSGHFVVLGTHDSEDISLGQRFWTVCDGAEPLSVCLSRIEQKEAE